MGELFDCNDYITLVMFSEDPRVDPEDRAMALAVLDGLDDMREEEVMQVTRSIQRKPTGEQRARFERRLDEEIARIRDERECQNII